ncbi:hypothetical protein BKA65DRAFT_572127 [Rhexocercosporidium sp. MPI-PUGE-AT-0058]|nr:hypothetical protein BKA65DRAFT_572127 [Rhexocercosporidium sp. MPI-PUGE-AT-0058]
MCSGRPKPAGSAKSWSLQDPGNGGRGGSSTSYFGNRCCPDSAAKYYLSGVPGGLLPTSPDRRYREAEQWRAGRGVYRTVVEYQIPERAQLAEFICNHVTDITPQEIVARRIHFAGLMLGLCRRREVPRRYRLRVALPEPPLVKEESPLPALEPFPLKLAKDQCPICIGDESKSYEERIGSFCRPAKMMDHVERIHLEGRDPHAKIECYHPACKSQGLFSNK